MTIIISSEGFPIRFQSQSQKFNRSFKTVDEVREFLQAELAFWAFVLETSKAAGVPQNEALRLINQAGRMAARQANSTLASSGNDANGAQQSLNVIDRTNAVLGAGSFGRAIRDLAETYPSAVAGMVFAASRSLSGANLPNVEQAAANHVDLDLIVRGVMLLARERSGRSEKAIIEEAATRAQEELADIEDRKDSFSKWLENQRADMSKLTASIEAAAKELREANDQKLAAQFEVSVRKLAEIQLGATQHLESLQASMHRDVDGLVSSTTERLAKIENVYVSKLVLKGPSDLWLAVSESSARSKWAYLALFASLALAPIVWLLLSWAQVADAVTTLIGQSSTGFSLTGLAVLTIPALAYGWLLRHVSRLFIHNLTLQSDAQYREVLAKTFLGLSDQNVTGITEAERALVLNALFRPTPPQSADDGPPIGILDLIKK